MAQKPMTLEQQLQSIETSKKIKGIEVTRIDNEYAISGMQYPLEEAVRHLQQLTTQDDFSKQVYLCTSRHNQVVLSHHKLASRHGFQKLVDEAIRNEQYVWHAAVQEIDGKYYVKPPMIIDWESVPDGVAASGTVTTEFACPHCNKVMKSKFGVTNHINAKHKK